MAMFVYHACPPALLGEILYSLRVLAAISPEHYARELSKYGDYPARRRIPQQRVPKLGCARQEVLNFAPIHPQIIFQAWADLGVALPSRFWFRIPVERLAKSPAVVFAPREGAAGEDVPDTQEAWFDAEVYRELTELPPAALEGYRELHKAGKRGAWFAGVPHVLVKGPVSVAGLEPLDWSAPAL